jgi:large subunit ribosomal protein L7Ae
MIIVLGKKPAAAPFGATKTTKAKNPLFEANVKNFGIGAFSCHRLSLVALKLSLGPGQDIRPQTDLTRFVK